MDELKTTSEISPRSHPVPFAHHPLSIARIRSTVKLGFKSLWNHRLRSLLTVLGIVFGVCSVIAMLAIGEGTSYEIQEQIRSLGSNNIIIRSVKPPEDKTNTTANQSMMLEYGLTYNDIDCIKETIPSVQIKVPARIIRQDLWRGGKRVSCDIYGTVPWYPEVSNRQVAEGRFFTRDEFDAKATVCVLEKRTADALFPLDPPVGNRVHIGPRYYQVVGVLGPAANPFASDNGEASGPATKGASGTGHRMYIPLSTERERFGETIFERQSGSMTVERVELHEAIIQVKNQEDVIDTSEVIEAILNYHHKKTDYEIDVPLRLLQQAEETKRIFNIVLGAIAAISLVVGGIGIMNIMLASVTERTREIGVRRALGAKRRDIVVQFLIETVLLSATGGVIGVALGIAIPFFITRFADMKTVVTLWSPIIAFSISALVGVVFGIYPAFRAANMDPVEALRHE